MYERSNEDLLTEVAAGPGALPEFYRRHVAKVMGMGVRRFSNPEDVADFVANVFLEVLRSAGGFDPRRGSAVSWLYGLAGNVATGMYRQQARSVDAQQRLAGRVLLDADDYARVEERIDAASALRRAHEAMRQLTDNDRRLLELGRRGRAQHGRGGRRAEHHARGGPGTAHACPAPAACRGLPR